MDSADNKKKILMVDDDEIQLSVAQAVLKADYDVIAVESGKKALEQLYNGFIPDIILLDILMPEMDGFEVYNRIRAISLLQDIPIAFLTSVGGKDDIQQAQEIGAADYIMKPYSKEDLLFRLKNIIKNR